MVRSKAAGSVVRTVPTGPMPALTTTASMPPKRSTVPSTARPSASQSVTSASNQAAPAPHCSATRRSSSGSSPTNETPAPREASRRADSAPIPRAAPVIRTVLPRTLQSTAASLSELPHQPAVAVEGRLAVVVRLEQPEALERQRRRAVPVAQVEPAVVGHAEGSAEPVHRAHHRLEQLSLRSEEHTSELQSHSDLVCRLLL